MFPTMKRKANVIPIMVMVMMLTLLWPDVPRIVNANDNNDEGHQQQHQQLHHDEAQKNDKRLYSDAVSDEAVASLTACSSELSVLQNQVLNLEQKLLEQPASTSAACKLGAAATTTTDHLDDASLLELFLISAKEKLLQSVPPTDAQCGFDVITGKCTPICQCEFRPQWGDYSPAHACRLISAGRLEGTRCDPNKREAPWVVKLAQVVGHHVGKAMKQMKAKLVEIAPPSDEDCLFSFKSMNCEPKDLCIWDFHPGDFSLDRACRYRIDAMGENDTG